MAHWQEEGKEPDYRFSLANERTFLAWVRTALGLLAAGVFLHELALGSLKVGSWLAVALAGAAALVGAAAYWRWRGNEIAMRHARPLPRSTLIVATAIGLAVLSVAAALLIATGWT
ncbi:YidH family protein [Ramlibacter sp.]|uniref:YidH family protein n=1 Tax=Ramlibacter sp. TaxID=1917967 RepID=UPI003D0C1968